MSVTGDVDKSVMDSFDSIFDAVEKKHECVLCGQVFDRESKAVEHIYYSHKQVED